MNNPATPPKKKETTPIPPVNLSAAALPRKPKLSPVRTRKREIPEGLWTKCPKCGVMLYDKELDDHLKVCRHCGHHFPISARERINALVETCSFEEMDADMTSVDVLQFTGVSSYPERLAAYQKATGLKDAVVTGIGRIGPWRTALGVMDFGFLGGSMGMVVGEKFCRGVDIAIEENLPFVVVSCSGGARMHEGLVSLSQMAKTSAALARLDEKGGLYISLLSDPTTGGVAASFAMLGDIIIAEPNALIGFAGPRVIQQTIKIELPEGFQRSEFLLEHGFIDMIVKRHDLRSEIARLIDYCGK